MPLKIVATVKRLVEVFDEDEPSTNSASSAFSFSSKGKNNGAPLSRVTSSNAHGRNTPTASLAVPGANTSTSRGRGLGLGIVRRKISASRSLTPSSSPSPSASADEYNSPSDEDNDNDDDDEDSSSAEFDKMDVDAPAVGRSMSISPSTSRSSVSPVTPPPSAISPAPPKIVGSGSGNGAFSIFDRRLPWSSSSSDDKEKEREKERDRESIGSGSGGSGSKSHVQKSVLLTESASFPRTPVNHHHNAANILCAALPPSHPLNHLPPSNSSSTSTLTSLPSPPSSTPSYPSLGSSSSATLVPSSHTTGVMTGVDSEACTYATSMTLRIPSPKSNAHWAAGESLRTGMARVRFVVSCKITMTTMTGSTETFKAPEIEFPVGAVDQRTRAKILSEYETSVRQQQKVQPQLSKLSPTLNTSNLTASGPGRIGRPERSERHAAAAAHSRSRSVSPSTPVAYQSMSPLAGDHLSAPPRNSGESTGSFVTITGSVPSAPNGNGNSVSSGAGTPSSNSNSGLKLSFFERRSARKTPPPPAATTTASAPSPSPAGRPSTAGSVDSGASSIGRRSSASATVSTYSGPPPTMSIMSPVMGQLMSKGYEPTSQSSPSGVPRRSSARAASKVVPRLVRPRTASGVVTVPGSTGTGKQQTAAVVPAVEPTSGSGSGIGVRRRRLSLSPPPPASRPHPHPSNMNGNMKSTSTTYTTIPSGSRSVKLDVEHDTMRAWEEELDRIALYSKRRSIVVSPNSNGAAARNAANMMPVPAGVANSSSGMGGAHQ